MFILFFWLNFIILFYDYVIRNSLASSGNTEEIIRLRGIVCFISNLFTVIIFLLEFSPGIV